MNNLDQKFLPEEILVKIFKILQSKDILSLTLTCKTLNSIISDSRKLLERFVLKISDAKLEEKKLSTLRKYSKYSFEGKISADQLKDHFEFNGENICEITFSQFSIDVCFFKKILLKCLNVKKIKLIDANFINDNVMEIYQEPLPRLTLSELEFFSNFEVLRLFSKCVINTVIVGTKYSSNFEILNEFTNIKSLRIYGQRLDWPRPDENPSILLKMPNLKRLELVDWMSDNNAPFSFDSNQIEELHILEESDDQHWLVEFLDHPKTNLKYLGVEMEYSNDTIEEALKRNKEKIKKIYYHYDDIWLSEFSDDDLYDYDPDFWDNL